ncbi:MAG: IS110 family transposase [Bacteroidota bacterium]
MKILQLTRPNSAGIDVGSEQMFVGLPNQEVKSYATYTSSLAQLVSDLLRAGIESVAMESTGVYGMILFQMLREAGLEVYMVHPKYTKSRSGKKTDVQDCQWIQQLHQVDLLEPSFIPPSQIEELRSYVRLRETHIQTQAQQVNRMQKALVQMNLRLDTVLSQLHGASGMKMIRAIVEGERDSEVLLGLCHQRIKKHKAEAVKEALKGYYQAHHLFALEQAVKSFDFIADQIQACDQQIDRLFATMTSTLPQIGDQELPPRKRIRHHRPEIPQLQRYIFQLCGNKDLTQLPGFTDYSLMRLIAEVGTDLSPFPSAKHFTSWLKLAPGQRQSGKSRKRIKAKNSPRAGQIFREIAQSLIQSKRYALGAFGRRIRAKKGPAIAIKALARKLAVLFYHAMTKGIKYVEKGIEQYQRQVQQQKIKAFLKQAELYGLPITRDDLIREMS